MALVNRYNLTPDGKALIVALAALAVWEQQAEDLDYPEGDPRREIPDADMPPEYLDERDTLAMQVTYCAALVAGERCDDAETYRDTFASPSNPYSVVNVRCAVAIMQLMECK